MDSRRGSVPGRRLALALRNAGKSWTSWKSKKGRNGRNSRKGLEKQRTKSERFLNSAVLTRLRNGAIFLSCFLVFLLFSCPSCLFLLLFSFRILVGFLPRFLSGKPGNSCHRVSRAAPLKLVRPIGG